MFLLVSGPVAPPPVPMEDYARQGRPLPRVRPKPDRVPKDMVAAGSSDGDYRSWMFTGFSKHLLKPSPICQVPADTIEIPRTDTVVLMFWLVIFSSQHIKQNSYRFVSFTSPSQQRKSVILGCGTGCVKRSQKIAGDFKLLSNRAGAASECFLFVWFSCAHKGISAKVRFYL